MLKKILKRAVGAAVALCMMMTTVTSIAAQPIYEELNTPYAASTQAEETNLALHKTATASDVESGTSFTADLTVDATAPEISSDVAENQNYCEDGLRIAFRDDHLKSVTLNGTEMTYAAEDGWYVLRLSAVSGSQEGQQPLPVTDEAGNGTTVHIQWYAGAVTAAFRQRPGGTTPSSRIWRMR